ncbi:MAG: hypothetical protein VW683_02800 [Betaproteobacteria bacterium]
MSKLKCVAIGGEPATGKTTLMKTFLEMVKPEDRLKFGLVRGHLSRTLNLAVLGLYGDGKTFEGTDMLSMAVNPHFVKYIEKNNRNIAFEGDRLFTVSNLEKLDKKYDLRLIILQQDEKELEKRHKKRNDTQTEKFLKGRKTKISNILSAFQGKTELFKLNEINDTFNLAEELLEWLKPDTRR